ncbi:orotidine-5'-phosphate decarboxylase [Candidatus Roizmanbacteria bacterium]|nr:orotidine-5'-phosphate decarboxylase [Candidatus Roizmanbacteria bacterium]
MIFQEKIAGVMESHDSFVCVGLDSDYTKLPEAVKTKQYAQYAFNQAIIDATHDLVCAYKPNTAFYEARGVKGIQELKWTCEYIHEHYPEVPIILDAKRADIGNTNNGYVSFAYDYLEVDAVTVHPYLGKEAIQPFLDRKDKGTIILCRTSNPGAGELQDIKVEGKPFYLHLAEKISKKWNENENCLLVVGATYPEEMKQIREVTGDMTFLVPGIGAQGGDIKATLEAGLNSNKEGLIVSSSRGVIFASNGEDFAENEREETLKLRNQINQYR